MPNKKIETKTKTKIAAALVVTTLLCIASVAPSIAHAEDAASASYQIRLAAYDVQELVATSDTLVKPDNPDQARPIKLKLRHRIVKTAHHIAKTPSDPTPAPAPSQVAQRDEVMAANTTSNNN
ncbi:MAG TPA: hypothetical protein VGG27_02205 [Magnetospirillaceae bacterium]|jgi:hypothetical protein